MKEFNCLCCGLNRFPIDKCKCERHDKLTVPFILVNDNENTLIEIIDHKKELGMYEKNNKAHS